MWGAEANVWKNLFYNYPGTDIIVDLMAGFRFLSLDNELEIGSISVFNPTIAATSPFASFAGNRLAVLDSFRTHNRYYGGQIGIDAKYWPMDRLCAELTFKLALGDTSQDLTIAGNQLRTFADGTSTVSNGGLLALPSNIGHFH